MAIIESTTPGGAYIGYRNPTRLNGGRGGQGGPTAVELYANRVGAGRGGQGGPTAAELAAAQSLNVENKTQTPGYKIIQGSEQNVLNGYRSYTYNFTMAALSLAEVNNPESYRGQALTRVILKSGGKGPDAIVNDSELTREFNKKSAGRFDMFIDNLEIESLMTFTESSSVSLPTSISFDVIEPYSITGFIEALQIAAVSAGYPNYVTASFVLKMEFQGYSDSVPIEDSAAEHIPNSTRYFMFKFTGVSVDITEQGTRYRCAAVPWNQAGFGEPNILKKPITIEGKNVKDILNNFMEGINSQIKKANEESKNVDKNLHDEYAILFPSVTPAGFDPNVLNTLSTSPVSNFKSNTSYAFIDQTTSTATDAYGGPPAKGTRTAAAGQKGVNPTNITVQPTVQFREGAAIHECISAIIRDSEYGSNIIEKLAGVIDEYGFFNYFLINIEVTNLLDIDTVKRKPRQKYTYIITPYRMHYTIVPGYTGQNIDVTKIKKYISLREYNYIYMGKNVDVLTFKINFNTLYFEAVPYAMGNNDKLRTVNTAAPDDGNKPGESPAPNNSAKNGSISPTPTRVTVEKAGDIQPAGGTGNAPQTDPYTIMSRNMHNAIINSSVGMVTGEIEIIGDPFFLVTGGTGNYNPKLENIGKTVNGESAYNYGEVYVTINFRNPIDISTFAEGGQVYFSKENAQFGGVYKVIKAHSSFKHGLFTQRLELLRLPGQISDNTPKSDPKTAVTSAADTENASVVDSSTAIMPGLRATFNSPGLLASAGISGLKLLPGLNLASTLDRAFPGVGNFTAAVGGLGGNILNSVSGAVTSGIGNLTSGAAIFGGSIPGGVDQLASGIRLNAAGLVNTGGIQAGVAALTAGTLSDPAAMASKLGINTSQISGLVMPLKSKLLGQLGSITDTLPATINLGIAEAQGMALDLIPRDKLANIPAIAPFATAPLPALPDVPEITQIATGNLSGLPTFNPLARISVPSVTSPLSTLYSLTSGKK